MVIALFANSIGMILPLSTQLREVQEQQRFMMSRIWEVERALHSLLPLYNPGDLISPLLPPDGNLTSEAAIISDAATTSTNSTSATNTTASINSTSNSSNGKVCELPPIDKSNLLLPDQVVEKYPKLLKVHKLTRLTVKLAQEGYFGKEVMKCCTVMGTGEYHALPPKELKQLKDHILHLSVPRFFTDRAHFEPTWKACIESIGQSCKGLRST